MATVGVTSSFARGRTRSKPEPQRSCATSWPKGCWACLAAGKEPLSGCLAASRRTEFPDVNQAFGQGQRSVWSLWVAVGLLVVGGLMPLVFGGTSSRVAGVILPFGVAAIALGAIALLQTQSRTILAAIYFVAGPPRLVRPLPRLLPPTRSSRPGTCPPP